MRKVRIFAHVSLDGVIAPGGRNVDDDYAHGGWTAPSRTADGARAVAEAQGDRFDLLLGRRTYDLWAGHWPTVKTGLFADGLNAATKYVATHRPDGLGWGPAQSLGADVLAGVRRLRSEDGPDLAVWGSSTLTSVLLERGSPTRSCCSSTRCCWAGASPSSQTGRTRPNSRSSAPRPRPRACS